MPETMVRKQVYIERDQELRLKEYARALNVTEAELIRRGIDAVIPANNASTRMMLRETADAVVESAYGASLVERVRGWSRAGAYGSGRGSFDDDGMGAWRRTLEIMRSWASGESASDAGLGLESTRARDAASAERGWSREDAYGRRPD